MSRFYGSAVLLLALVPAAASAKDTEKKQAAAFRDLVECRTITDNAARLACFDRSAAALDTAERNGDLVVADKAQIREAKKAVFGYGGIRIPFLSGDDADMPEQIEATITGLRDLGYNRWEITLDNGMRWRQTDDMEIFPKVGTQVTIKTAAMGSYLMKIKSRAIRVMRTR